MNKKNYHIIMIITVLVCSCSLIYGILRTVNINSDVGNHYKTVSDMEIATGLKILAPEFVLNEKDIKYIAYSGPLAVIKNDRMYFGCGNYIADNVSAVGGYKDYTFDKSYSIKSVGSEVENNADNIILWIRYRYNDEETILDYYTKDFMYGIKMSKYNGKDGMEALINSIGIKSDDLIERQNDNNKIEYNNTEEEINNKTATEIYLKFKTVNDTEAQLKIPVNTDKIILKQESNETSLIILSDKLIGTLGYGEISKAENVVDLGGGYYLIYFKTNPFEIDTTEYKIYTELIDNINSIKIVLE